MPNLEIKQVEVFFSQEHQAVVAYKNDKPQTALAALFLRHDRSSVHICTTLWKG